MFRFIPLIATITLATLSIVPGMAVNSTNLIVPTLDLNSSTPSSYYDGGIAYTRRRLDPGQRSYITDPSIELSKALTRTATAGRVTPSYQEVFRLHIRSALLWSTVEML